MAAYMGEVTRDNRYGWYGRLWQIEIDEQTFVIGQACLTRHGARAWIRRQAKKHAREQARIRADKWTFVV